MQIESRVSSPTARPAVPDLFRANAANRLLVSRSMSYGPGYVEHPHPHCEILISGIAHPVCNGVFRARLPDAGLEQEVDRILALFRDRKLPALFWVEEDAQPARLADVLLARGATFAWQVRDLAVDLDGMAIPPLPEITMQPLRTTAERTQWAALFAGSFDLPERVREHVASVLGSARMPDAVESYLVSAAGEPVATVTLCFSDGVAGIYNVTVRPEFRGKDLAQAMLARAIARVLERGYRFAVGSAVDELLPFYGKAPLTVLGTTRLFVV